MKKLAIQHVAAHPLKAGDILYSSWGYDQTNIDWYVVDRVTESMAIYTQIKADVMMDGPMADTGTSSPEKPIKRIGKPLKGKVLEYGGEPRIKVTSFEIAKPWDGKPKKFSTGH